MKIQTVDLEDVVNLDLEEDFETEFVNDFCFVDTIVDLQKLPALPHTKIKKASDAVFFVETLLRKLTHECTFAIFLDARLTPLSYACVGVGTSTICPVSMSKIAQLALLTNCTGVILVHNHPDVTKPALSIWTIGALARWLRRYAHLTECACTILLSYRMMQVVTIVCSRIFHLQIIRRAENRI